MLPSGKVTVPDVLRPGDAIHHNLYMYIRGNRSSEHLEDRIPLDHPDYKIALNRWKLRFQMTPEFIMGFLKFNKRREYNFTVINVVLSQLGQQAMKVLDRGGIWDRTQRGECEILTRQHWERRLCGVSLSEIELGYLKALGRLPAYSDLKGKTTMWLMTATPKKNGGRNLWLQEQERDPDTGELTHARSDGFKIR